MWVEEEKIPRSLHFLREKGQCKTPAKLKYIFKPKALGYLTFCSDTTEKRNLVWLKVQLHFPPKNHSPSLRQFQSGEKQLQGYSVRLSIIAARKTTTLQGFRSEKEHVV